MTVVAGIPPPPVSFLKRSPSFLITDTADITSLHECYLYSTPIFPLFQVIGVLKRSCPGLFANGRHAHFENRLKAWLIFECNLLEVLRPLLEDRRVTISQPKVSGEYHALFMLVSAMNP
jgi:hypothetical protein